MKLLFLIFALPLFANASDFIEEEVALQFPKVESVNYKTLTVPFEGITANHKLELVILSSDIKSRMSFLVKYSEEGIVKILAINATPFAVSLGEVKFIIKGFPQ